MSALRDSKAAACTRSAMPLVPLAALLLLAGCATLSERECRDQDWYGIGADDGFDGALASTIEDHRKACTEYGIEPDAEQYEVGRRDGLKQYCTVTRGFDIGRKGMMYGGGCPTGAERWVAAAQNGSGSPSWRGCMNGLQTSIAAQITVIPPARRTSLTSRFDVFKGMSPRQGCFVRRARPGARMRCRIAPIRRIIAHRSSRSIAGMI